MPMKKRRVSPTGMPDRTAALVSWSMATTTAATAAARANAAARTLELPLGHHPGRALHPWIRLTTSRSTM